MHWTRAAAAVAVVLGAVALAQGGCEPHLSNPMQPTVTTAPIAVTAVTNSDPPDFDPRGVDARSVDPGTLETTVQPESTDQPLPRPAGGSTLTGGVSGSPSVPPKPSRVAASPSPSAQTLVPLVAVSMAKDNRIAEIDPVTARVVRTVDLSEPAGSMTLAPDGRTAWVFKPQGRGGSVALLDVPSGARREDIQFREGESPLAVAFSTDASRAYVAVGGTVVFASSAGKEFGRIPLGQQTSDVSLPHRITSLAVGAGPSGDVLYAADAGTGTVWALDGGSGAVLNALDIGGGPTLLLPDPARQRVYVLVGTLNQVVSIDTATSRIANRLDLGAPPSAGTIGNDGTLYVVGGDDTGAVWLVTPDATSVRAQVPVGSKPAGIALNPDGTVLFVSDAATNALDVISADTVQVMRTVALASQPVGMVMSRTSTMPAASSTPSATPTLVPSPTPLPQGALPPDKLPASAIAEPFVSGAAMPAAMSFAPDGRLFYAEQRTGTIRVVQDGALLPDPFYQLLVASQPDSGLFGLTLDPDFQRNHFVYAYYAAPSGPSEIVRLTDVDSKGTDLKPILQDLPGAGAIQFGPDGKLYVSVADDRPTGKAPDLMTLSGTILRINADGTVPDDNPFVGQQGKQPAIWAYGLHHVASLAFHPLGHQLLAAESSGDHDALQMIVRGGDYGTLQPLAVIKPPVRLTGSTFYLGNQLPDWTNDWFYCNANLQQLRRVHVASQTFDRIGFEEVVKQGCSSDVATGPDGALYYSDAQGIYRIRMRQPTAATPAPG